MYMYQDSFLEKINIGRLTPDHQPLRMDRDVNENPIQVVAFKLLGHRIQSSRIIILIEFLDNLLQVVLRGRDFWECFRLFRILIGHLL